VQESGIICSVIDVLIWLATGCLNTELEKKLIEMVIEMKINIISTSRIFIKTVRIIED
jgi:hypothetical protein